MHGPPRTDRRLLSARPPSTPRVRRSPAGDLAHARAAVIEPIRGRPPRGGTPQPERRSGTTAPCNIKRPPVLRHLVQGPLGTVAGGMSSEHHKLPHRAAGGGTLAHQRGPPAA